MNIFKNWNMKPDSFNSSFLNEPKCVCCEPFISEDHLHRGGGWGSGAAWCSEHVGDAQQNHGGPVWEGKPTCSLGTGGKPLFTRRRVDTGRLSAGRWPAPYRRSQGWWQEKQTGQTLGGGSAKDNPSPETIRGRSRTNTQPFPQWSRHQNHHHQEAWQTRRNRPLFHRLVEAEASSVRIHDRHNSNHWRKQFLLCFRLSNINGTNPSPLNFYFLRVQHAKVGHKVLVLELTFVCDVWFHRKQTLRLKAWHFKGENQNSFSDEKTWRLDL